MNNRHIFNFEVEKTGQEKESFAEIVRLIIDYYYPICDIDIGGEEWKFKDKYPRKTPEDIDELVAKIFKMKLREHIGIRLN